MHAVEQCVGDLVCNDVMREAGEYGGRRAGTLHRGAEVAEENRFATWTVERIRLTDRMRIQSQVLDKVLIEIIGRGRVAILGVPRRPQRDAAERLFEVP